MARDQARGDEGPDDELDDAPDDAPDGEPDDAPDGEPDDAVEQDEQDEQDLLVVLRLSNRQMGTNRERQQLDELGNELEAAVLAAGAGEYDGDELGGGECVLFFCGPDVERLMAVLRPLLAHHPLARGGHFVRLTEGPDGAPQRQVVPF